MSAIFNRLRPEHSPGSQHRLTTVTRDSLMLCVSSENRQKWAYLPEPAIPDLLQVEKTVAADICGFQELDWGIRGQRRRCFSVMASLQGQLFVFYRSHSVTLQITFTGSHWLRFSFLYENHQTTSQNIQSEEHSLKQSLSK